ncbi:MAG: cytochrome P450 [Nevskiales bacterium]
MTGTAASVSAYKPIPTERGWPLVGTSLRYLRDAHGFLMDNWQRYGEVSCFYGFGTQSISLLGPDATQFVYQNRDGMFASSVWEHFLGPFFHRGLMLLDGDEHRLHRRIMQSAFKREALQEDLAMMQPRIQQDVAAWQTTGSFKVFDHLKDLTLNVGSEVFIGHEAGPATAAMNKAFLATVRAGTDPIRLAIPGTRWHQGIRGRAYLDKFFKQELPHKRAKPGPDLFSRLCEARTDEGELFSDEDVINHIIFVLMAAHDTSTITLTNMMYQLARHPEWQTRLREASQALAKTTLDYDDLEQLEDIDLVMKEALRLCAPVPMMPRVATRDIEYKGFLIPKGHQVAISPWLNHYLPEYWSEPMQFDPERFNTERAEDKQHPFLWVPFGGGAHKCIGLHFGQMEVKAILHQILLRYRWSVPEDYVMQQDFTSLPIPKDRLPVKLEAL